MLWTFPETLGSQDLQRSYDREDLQLAQTLSRALAGHWQSEPLNSPLEGAMLAQPLSQHAVLPAEVLT